MKENKLVWADPDHLWAWKAHLDSLEEWYGYKITRLVTLDTPEVLSNCSDQLGIVIHCGTYNPIANLVELLETVRSQYPDIKIGLLTEVKHPYTENLVDFYVPSMPSLDELLENLNYNLS